MNMKYGKSKRIMTGWELLGILMILVTVSYAWSEETAKPSSRRLTPEVMAVENALPWVVNIGTRERIQINDPFNLFFDEFFNPHYSQQTKEQYFPLGSGVIIDGNGLVLTNNHVVQRASAIEIRLWNGETHQAKIVGYDVPNDLCLLQLTDIEPSEKLKAAPFAACNDLILGETVITIGNPFGLEHSVSSGVLSATNRGFVDQNISFSDILQTDASINPGNSGGPLVNLDGDLIGINLAIRADAQGIGFAIPLARIEMFLSSWMKPSHFSNCYLGLPPSAIIQKGDKGVLMPEIIPGSPLAEAGVSRGDEVVATNGAETRRPIDFARAIWRLAEGDTVELRLADGTVRTVTAAPMPDELLVATRLGLKLEPLTVNLKRALGITNENFQGIILTEVLEPDFFSMQQQSWRDILKRGDIIIKFAETKVSSVDDIARILADSKSGDVVRMEVYSINQTRKTVRPMAITLILD